MDIDVVSIERSDPATDLISSYGTNDGETEWRYSLLGQGLEVNSVMVSRRTVVGCSESVYVVSIGN